MEPSTGSKLVIEREGDTNEGDTNEMPLVNTNGHVKVCAHSDQNRRCVWLLLLTLVIVLTCAVTVLIIVLVVMVPDRQEEQEPNYCPEGNHVTPRDLDNPGIFDDLTPAEYDAVNDYMLNVPQIDLVPFHYAKANNSYIYMIDIHPPPKADVISFLDGGERRSERKAKVVVVRGSVTPPRVEEYIVSPLPNPSKHVLWANPSYRRNPIPYSSRPLDNIDYKHFAKILDDISEKLYPVLQNSFGLWYHNCTEGVNCLDFIDFAPSWLKSGERRSWFCAYREVEGIYNNPLPFEILINHQSTDFNEWEVQKVYYNGQMFESADALLKGFLQNTIDKTKLKQIGSDLHSSYNRRGAPDTAKPIPGPRLVEPAGRRFKVRGRHINYMKWDFNLRMSSTNGLQLFNIRFNGERLAYEISLRETLVMYSGYAPAQGTINYYDVSYKQGSSNHELARGVDCPDTAVFLDSHHFVNSGKWKLYKNSICVFEDSPSMPLRRHFANDYEGSYTFYGGMVGYNLVVRTIVDVWNYDYILDYIFHQNGAIEVKASATGYVQAAFGLSEEQVYGNFILPGVVANLHQHLFNYKVDLDIGGEQNRFATWKVGLETIQHPWEPSMNKTQMKIIKSIKKTESEAITKIEQELTPKYAIIYNENATNKYGTKRAYRILNKDPTNFLVASADVAKAAQWAKYPVAITKRKDSEDSSTSIYAQRDPWDPVVDFDDFLNDENILDEDLVAWITLGTHHIPHTEDVPSTPTAWNHYSFFLQPFNYFDEDPSTSSSDIVVIRPGRNKKSPSKVDTSVVSYDSTCVPKYKGPFDYYGRHGYNV